MKPQSARIDPKFRAKARLVRKSETDCRGPIWRVVLWPRASSQRSVTLLFPAGGSTRGSLRRTDRMEVWVEETALRRSMVVSRTAWWRWMLKNWLPEQSRQWKGDSSASMVEPQEHRKDPGAQTSEDAGGGGERVKGAYGGTWCIREGTEGVPAVESPNRSAEPPATRALEHRVLGPDGTGLESSLMETADDGIHPALLDKYVCMCVCVFVILKN